MDRLSGAASSRRLLLTLLADGCFHSGESLGHELGLSRAAIWKQIQALQNEGLRIEAAHAKGYRLLSQVELLDKELILAQLPANRRDQVELLLFDELESSNHYLMQPGLTVKPGRVPVCLTEKQTAGRGRRGRQWQTPYATAVALSLRWTFDSGAGGLAGLSLAVGVAVLRAVFGHGVCNARLKWPNDLICGNAKLGGILIEIAGDAAGPCNVVIGVGLNISNSTTDIASSMHGIEQDWTDMISQQSGPQRVSRNQIAADLVSRLLEALFLFQEQGFRAFMQAYAEHDALAGRNISVLQGGEEIRGIAGGVDETGRLLLNVGEKVVAVNSGDVSVRAS